MMSNYVVDPRAFTWKVYFASWAEWHSSPESDERMRRAWWRLAHWPGKRGTYTRNYCFRLCGLTLHGYLRRDRPCTCHPDDNPPRPCPKKYALQECRQNTQPSNGTCSQYSKGVPIDVRSER